MITKFGARLYLEPQKVALEILDYVKQSEGNRVEAARLSGVPYRSFMRAIQKLQLGGELDSLCASNGWIVRRGGERTY